MPRASPAALVAKPKKAAPAPVRGANARSTGSKAAKRRQQSHLTARANGINTSTDAEAEKLDPNKPLTERQLAFVKLWAEGHTILMASVKAGYNDGGSFAYRMARMPHLLRRYQLEKVKYEEAAQMTREKVMRMLMESYETAKMVAEPSSMVGAAREIGKMCGYYEPVTIRHQHDVQGEIVHRRLDRMSDKELIEFVAEQQRRIEQSPDGATTAGMLSPLLEKSTESSDVEDAVIVGGAD